MSDRPAKAAPRRGELPFSIEAECSVLGAALLDPDALVVVMTRLQQDDFYFLAHELIFNALPRALQAHGVVTLVTLTAALKDRDTIDRVDELTAEGTEMYLARLQGDYLAPLWVGPHCAIVKQYADRRRQIEQGAAMVREGFSGTRRRNNGTGGYE